MLIRIALFAACLAGISFPIVFETTVFANEPEPTPQLRLQYRSSNQGLLYVAGQGQAEADKAETICDEQNLPFKSIQSLETLPLDCSNEHAIIIGSNAIDFLGWHEDKDRVEEVFQTLERFVAKGGHLFFFGSYNGRNSERLETFGIQTTHFHNDYFTAVPGRTDVLFKGFEATIPSPPLVHSFGNVIVDEDRELAVMLKRGKSSNPDDRKAEHNPDSPALVTIAHKRGRVSYSPVEPHSGGMWLVPIVVNWILDGAPTNANQVHEDVVVAESLLRVKNSPRGPALTPDALRRGQTAFQDQFESDLAVATTPEENRLLAQKIVQEASTSIDPIHRYVFLRVACQKFANAEQFRVAAELISELTNEYQFDVHHARLKLIEATPQPINDTDNLRDLAESTLRWANENVARHRFQDATELLSQAIPFAINADSTKLAEQLQMRLDELLPIANAETSLLTELESAVDDPKTMVGKFFALTCGSWGRGLPLIAEGSDPVLQPLATFDLDSPENAEKQIELAEDWYAAAQNLSGLESTGAKKRARHWYLAALPRMPGSEREKVLTQIKQLDLPETTLTFEFDLDGAARIEISPDGIWWIHHYGPLPPQVRMNDITWNPSEETFYQNSGLTRFMPVGTSLQMPRLQKLEGRGLVAFERNDDGRVIVNLNDVSTGSDHYRFEVVLTR